MDVTFKLKPNEDKETVLQKPREEHLINKEQDNKQEKDSKWTSRKGRD